MKDKRKFVEEIFSLADITLNGSKPWDITVHDSQFYQRLLSNAELSLGETYVEGQWDCPRLDEFFYKILTVDLEKKALSRPPFWRSAINLSFYQLLQNLINYQTNLRSFIVGRHHYDIGNELYSAMLDKRMIYSCANWSGVTNLDDAQELKLKLICERLNLQSGMKILDVGCGWGGFAKYIVENYNVSVVGLTVSQKQYEFAKKSCEGLPIEIRLQDYRELLKTKDEFNRVVSIGMFEHVGYKNYPIYMKTISHCLKKEGIFYLHTIGANKSNNSSNIWINKYIFPNAYIPTIAQLASSFENQFVMENWNNIGPNYDLTLMAWYQNFTQNWDKLSHKYDERFRRVWSYYLLSCAGSFRARHNQVWQIMLSKQNGEL